MEPWARIGTLTACVALAIGCNEQTEVQRQTHDLQQAQKDVGKVRQELETQLERAKADVARLEQKVALARQGLTDEVLENQRELQAALQAQEHRVANELGEAKREAQIHSRDTEAALKQLGQTTAPAGDPALATPEPVPPSMPAAAPSDAPREDLVPVRGTDREAEGSGLDSAAPTPQASPEPPPAPLQPTAPVTDPTAAVPPLPPRLPPNSAVSPSDPPMTDAPPSDTAAPAEPAPAQP